MKRIRKRGDIREDGYIFMRYFKHQNGKTYESWISPLALQKCRERAAVWREANPDKARNAVKRWKEDNRDRTRKHNREYIQRRREAEKSA